MFIKFLGSHLFFNGFTSKKLCLKLEIIHKSSYYFHTTDAGRYLCTLKALPLTSLVVCILFSEKLLALSFCLVSSCGVGFQPVKPLATFDVKIQLVA